jgi:type IV secretion system protein VirB11
MRLRPTRLVIGEVRGPEALNLLVAWTTGTPGGITTLHADDCGGALQRLALLIQLAGVPNPHPLIAQAIHLIVHIDGRGTQRTLRAIHHVKPRDGGTYATVPA